MGRRSKMPMIFVVVFIIAALLSGVLCHHFSDYIPDKAGLLCFFGGTILISAIGVFIISVIARR